jgi:hypothetical protein
MSDRLDLAAIKKSFAADRVVVDDGHISIIYDKSVAGVEVMPSDQTSFADRFSAVSEHRKLKQAGIDVISTGFNDPKLSTIRLTFDIGVQIAIDYLRGRTNSGPAV